MKHRFNIQIEPKTLMTHRNQKIKGTQPEKLQNAEERKKFRKFGLVFLKTDGVSLVPKHVHFNFFK